MGLGVTGFVGLVVGLGVLKLHVHDAPVGLEVGWSVAGLVGFGVTALVGFGVVHGPQSDSYAAQSPPGQQSAQDLRQVASVQVGFASIRETNSSCFSAVGLTLLVIPLNCPFLTSSRLRRLAQAH